MMSSKNPNNPTNSSFVQMLQDASECGIPENLVKPLLEYTKNKQNITIVKKVDAKFKKHQYPLHSIDWIRTYNDIEFEYFLTEFEYMILCFLAKNMWTNNLVQVSQNDMLDYTHISSKGHINKAIQGLISKGCIAIKFKGNSRQKSVYMVNPNFSTVGVENKHNLMVQFWELTGTCYGDKETDTQQSEPHKKWLDLTADSKKHYYRGRSSKDGINFNETKKMNAKDKVETPSNTKKPSSKKEFDMDSVSAEIEEELPF